MPTAPGRNVEASALASVDFSNSADGYVIVTYLDPPPPEVMLLIFVVCPQGQQWQYPLRLTDVDYAVLPLAFGNGNYRVVAGELGPDGSFLAFISATFSVTLSDEFAPFLRPNRWVNYALNMEVVKTAERLLSGTSGLVDRVRLVYDFVVGHLTYNYELASHVNATNPAYIPDLDAVLASGKGICFDYASVMSAMLRSQGIITRMVIGYFFNPVSKNMEYHAWIDVYSDTDGWLNGIVFLDGKGFSILDPTIAASAGETGERHFMNRDFYQAQQFR
jgi:transglutaminase-like putative cysteine protease